MKIAKAIPGPEQLLKVPLSPHVDTGGLGASFAERFGESLTVNLKADSPSVKQEDARVIGKEFGDGAVSGRQAQQAKTAGGGEIFAKTEANPPIASALEPKVAPSNEDLRAEDADPEGVAFPEVAAPIPGEVKTEDNDDKQQGMPAEEPVVLPGQDAVLRRERVPVPGSEERGKSSTVLLATHTDGEEQDHKVPTKVKDVSTGRAADAKEHKISKASASDQGALQGVDADVLAISVPMPQASIREGTAMANPAANSNMPKTDKKILEATPAVAVQSSKKRPDVLTASQTIARQERRSDHELKSVATATTPKKEQESNLQEAKSAHVEPATGDATAGAKTSPATFHAVASGLQVGVGSTMASVHMHVAQPYAVEKTVPMAAHAASTHAEAEPAGLRGYVDSEHRTLTVTPTTLEVGLPGGTHGWLKVRAELTGDGGVHASVSSNSVSGTEMLRKELPTLTNYLHQEQVRVSSVMVHAPSSAMNLSNPSGESGGNHAMDEGSADAHGARDRRDGSSMSEVAAGGVQTFQEESETEGSLLRGYAGLGGWLSIRA